MSVYQLSTQVKHKCVKILGCARAGIRLHQPASLGSATVIQLGKCWHDCCSASIVSIAIEWQCVDIVPKQLRKSRRQLSPGQLNQVR